MTTDPWLVSDCHLLVLRYEHNTNKAHSLFTNLGSASVLTGIRERRYVPDKLRAGAVALVHKPASLQA